MTKSRHILPPRRPWLKSELELLRAEYPNELTYKTAKKLGRPMSTVYNRAQRIGLEKSAAFKASPASGRIHKGHAERGVATRFHPGQAPWCKGRKTGTHGRSGETQFKKGRPAHEARNYVPIGTEKIDVKRGVLVRKITDDPSIYPVARWRPVHVMTWEAAHGPVPRDHIVIFRRGMKTLIAAEITIDRLELVSLAENMRRNSYHTNYPPEIRQVIQLRGAVQRQINRRERNAKQD